MVVKVMCLLCYTTVLRFSWILDETEKMLQARAVRIPSL